jgi:hypothetical protein
MREEQIDFGAAMERIRRTRPGADPNLHFCMQLMATSFDAPELPRSADSQASVGRSSGLPAFGPSCEDFRRGTKGARPHHQWVPSFAGGSLDSCAADALPMPDSPFGIE